MIKGILHHTLKGIRGWSELNITRIDVAKVTKIYYRKRLFMLSDRNYPYALEIEYAEPKRETIMLPVRGGFVLTTDTAIHQTITKRYQTEIDAKNEMNEILAKQELLRQYAKQEETRLLQKMDVFLDSAIYKK